MRLSNDMKERGCSSVEGAGGVVLSDGENTLRGRNTELEGETGVGGAADCGNIENGLVGDVSTCEGKGCR